MERVMRTLILLLLVFIGAGGQAHAAVFASDYLAPGDGLLTFDAVNSLEYLDLSESSLANFPGELVEDRYQAVLAETARGGQYDGFRVASVAQAEALILSAGITPGGQNLDNFIANGAAAERLVDLLTPTRVFAGGVDRRSVGLLNSVTPNVPPDENISRDSLYVLFEPNMGVSGRAGGFIGLDYLIETQTFPNPDNIVYGVLLVRNAIPEPTALAIAFTTALFAIARQRLCQA